MTFILNISIIFISHLSCLILYPDTGKLGFPFLFISILLWIGFLFYLKSATINLKNDTIIFLNIIYILAMIVCLMTLTPQEDSISIMNKIIKGYYPDKKSIYKGLLKIGIERPDLLKEILEEENKKKSQ